MSDQSADRARELVLSYGWNATAYQILNPGIAHWFSVANDAVVGYARHRRVRVVAGAPVCAPERLQSVVAEFAADARAHGDRVCYFGAGERLESSMRDGRHGTVGLGAQPSWDPRRWVGIVEHRASLRAQLNRARNKGVVVKPWSSDRARKSPELERVLGEWLHGLGLPPLHFLIETETIALTIDRRIFVAERAGAVVSYLVASPVPARRGWLIEQIVRGRGAPNGTSELLVDAAMRALSADGAEYVTLGLAPLSRHSRYEGPGVPAWLALVLRWVRAHGRRFYDFDGLDRFKSKFSPEEWEEIIAIDDRAPFSPRALWAITGAFGGGSPLALLARTIARAIVQL
ncbi:MAG: phosphatidylglycerol lysyltransferase domain-containing protein, partial [Gemmatimonadaceae bacterium]